MQKQAKGEFFFVRRAVIGRRHALRSLPCTERMDQEPSVLILSLRVFDPHKPLNSTERMTGKQEVET